MSLFRGSWISCLLRGAPGLCAALGCALEPRCSRVEVPRAAARRRQSVLAAGKEASSSSGGGSGGGSGSGGGHQRRRDDVTFLIPGEGPLQVKTATQRTVDNMVRAYGAAGFKTRDGVFSSEVEDLPEHDAVELVLPRKLRGATQLNNLQQAADNTTRAKEFQMEGFLRRQAINQNPGATTIYALQTTPYKGMDDQDYVQLDAAIRVDATLYLAEFKAVLGETAVDDLVDKLARIRKALTGKSPELAAALQGVTHAKLYAGGDVVRRGMTVQQMVELAAAQGIAVVLPSGQALILAGGAAPAVQL